MKSLTLTGAPPEWSADSSAWEVTVHDSDGRLWCERWSNLTRLTVETTDPEALRRLLGNEHKIVEVDDE